jgi:hypothetical protein
MGISLNSGTWLTLIAVITFGLFQVFSSYVGNRHQRRELVAVRDQVQNAHPTNLRDDIDAIRTNLGSLREEVGDLRRNDLRGIREDINSLHNEVSAERAARADLEERVDMLSRRKIR